MSLTPGEALVVAAHPADAADAAEKKTTPSPGALG